MTPIEFRDENGLRWTVEHRAVSGAAGTRQAVIDLVCESGEHRVAEVIALDEGAWPDVNESAWRSLLRLASRPAALISPASVVRTPRRVGMQSRASSDAIELTQQALRDLGGGRIAAAGRLRKPVVRDDLDPPVGGRKDTVHLPASHVGPNVVALGLRRFSAGSGHLSFLAVASAEDVGRWWMRQPRAAVAART